MTRSRRNREITVPPRELAWVRADTDSWNTVAEPSAHEIRVAHFTNRQRIRNFLPERTAVELRYASVWKSAMKRISLGFMERPPPFKTPLLPLRERFVEKVKIYQRRNEISIHSQRDFNEIIDDLKARIQRLEPEQWMENAVFKALGPRQILNFLSMKPRASGRGYRCLVNNNHNTSFVFANGEMGRHLIKEVMEQSLKEFNDSAEAVNISSPGCNYAMTLKCGNDPEYITKDNETDIALIYDIQNNENCPAEVFYEAHLQCQIRYSRLLTTSQKKYLERKTGKYNLRSEKIRLIQFFSVEERNIALRRNNVEFLDVLYCDSMHDYFDPVDRAYLTISYDNSTNMKMEDGISVTLVHEEDKSFAESSFQSHALTVCYCDSNGKINDDLKYDMRVKTMNLIKFPPHLRTFEARQWLVKRIIDVNCFKVESIRPFAIPLEDRKYIKKDIISLINYDMYKIGHQTGIYRPIDGHWFEQLNGDVGVRNFLEVVMERNDVPWEVKRSRAEIPQQIDYRVYFENTEKGLGFLQETLRVAEREPIFRREINDYHGPILKPMYCRSFTITRVLRTVLDENIRAFDEELRTKFWVLSENEDPIMQSEESIYFGARVFEEWIPGDCTGVIGVQGWNVNLIQKFARKLKKILLPEEFDAGEKCPELMYGIGEKFAKELETLYQDRLLVDFDKFRQVINLFGSRTAEAIDDLESYSSRKKVIEVELEIGLQFPDYNTRVVDILLAHRNTLRDMELALGNAVYLLKYNRRNNSFDFGGTIEAYEVLTNALAELSSEIFKRETTHVQDQEKLFPTCYSCLSAVGNVSDYYRFSCGHTMCRVCANLSVQSRIDELQMKIPCGAPDCSAFITPIDIMNIVLGCPNRALEMDTRKLTRLTARARQCVISQNDEMRACTTVDCTGILRRTGNLSDEFGVCGTCNRRYCGFCMAEPHTGATCAQFERLRVPEESIKQYIREVGSGRVKGCPKCGIMVEKLDGCNHMKCGSCSTDFCWVCMYVALSFRDCYVHMQNEHGGHGGHIVHGENEEVELQRVLFDQVRRPRNQNRELLENVFDGRDLFPDTDDSDEEIVIDRRRDRRLNMRLLELHEQVRMEVAARPQIPDDPLENQENVGRRAF